MRKTILNISIFFILLLNIKSLIAQCTPAAVDNCADANVFCGLDEVNGYTCQNPSDIHAELYPCGAGILCPSAGGAYAPHNTSWLAFVSNGGPVTITMTTTNCGGAGVQFGIWGDCNCGEEVACNPFCAGPGTVSITANLTPCKIYYLFVDGCSGDVCYFTLSTSGGAPPTLAPLSGVNGLRMVCEGFCNNVWSVNPQPGTCDPEYIWTLDGVDLGSRDNEIQLDDEWGPGTYSLCVTAYIGNPQSGSICDEEGPVCQLITIVPKHELRGPDKYLCSHDVPYNWHGVNVSGDGEYKVTFVRGDCCKFDSVRQFFILPQPKKPSIYHIGCVPSDLYHDTITGNRYGGCHNPIQVDLYRSTQPFKCDSAYDLYTLFPSYQTKFWEFWRLGKKYLTFEIIDSTDYCDNKNKLSVQHKFRWYPKSDSTQTLGTTDTLEVNQKNDYCLERTSQYVYGTEHKICIFRQCETLNEDDIVSVYEAEVLENKIHFIPNPAQDFIWIKYPSDLSIAKVDILDLKGNIRIEIKNWKEREVAEQGIKINLQDIVSGVYLIKLNTNQGIIYKKLTVLK